LKESETSESIHYEGEGLRDQFDQVTRILVDAVRKGLPAKEDISWDYNYASLWSPKLRDTRGRKVNIWKCNPETFIGLLRTRTYWYKRLPKSSRMRVKKLAKDGKGRRKIKDVLDTCDGVFTSIYFAFPEMFVAEGYALSDRISNSVINSCFHNYDRFQKKLKLLRKTVRFHALMKKPMEIDFDNLRDMSYFVLPMKVFNKLSPKSSKEKMFRVAMFCQTRATGLAGIKQMEESVSEFLESVTQVKHFVPNELLERCIEAVTGKLASEVYIGRNAEFKVSMSTSACRESSKRNEGKFGYLKDLVRDAEITIPPLRDGIPGTLGNFLWYESVEKLKHNHDEVMKVNVAAIRENGKARIVTSGSFWKDVALQPFSHITIHLSKTFDNLRSGLQAGRLGWRFIEKLKYTKGDRDGFNWIFSGRPTYLYTTDWSKATDGPSPEQAWALTGKLLEKTGLDPESLAIVKEYWLGQKQLYYKGKHVGTLRSGIPMGDPLTKTNLSLAHPVCDLYARLKSACVAYEEGNGDDTVAPCDDPLYAVYHSECATMLGYERSPLDDVLTSDWGTYCEEWFHLPVSSTNTCQWGTRSKTNALLPYLDVPKIRCMIATQKDRIDFSSDPRGKVTLLGHDQEYINRNDSSGPQNAIFAIASAIQDITLATIDDPIPLFLPRQVNGVGKPPPFWSIESWVNIIKRCSRWHAKYYINCMDELNCGESGISGYRGALKQQNHFDKEMLVELFEIPRDDPIRRYIVVKSDGWSDFPEGVLLKLITLGYLIPESKLSKYYLFQERLEQLEQDTKRDLFEVIKSKMVELPDYTPEETKEVITEFVSNYRDAPYRLHVGKEENLYAAESIVKLEEGNPLVVSDHPYPLKKKFSKRTRPTNSYEENGLYLYQWFMGAVISRNRGEDFGLPPTDIIEDDPIIIREISDGGADVFFIATDDLKLVRLANNKFPDTWTFRIPCIQYLQANTYCSQMELDIEEELQRAFDDENGAGLVTKIIVDKGSVESWILKYHPTEEGTYWQTVGIPWRKDIKVENLEKKPHHGFIREPLAKSLSDLMIPRSCYDQRTRQILHREAYKARNC
jgi:hypothetical protein